MERFPQMSGGRSELSPEERVTMSDSTVAKEELEEALSGLDIPTDPVGYEGAPTEAMKEELGATKPEKSLGSETVAAPEVMLGTDRETPEITERKRIESDRIDQIRKDLDGGTPPPPERGDGGGGGGGGGGGFGTFYESVPVATPEVFVKFKICEMCKGKGRKFILFKCPRCGGRGSVEAYRRYSMTP